MGRRAVLVGACSDDGDVQTVTTDPAVIAERFQRAAKLVEAAGPVSVRTVAGIVEKSVDAKLVAALGADRILSGTTRTTGTKKATGKSKKGRIAVTAKPLNGGPSAQILIGLTGPAQLIENDVKKHIVVSKWVKGAAYTKVNAKGKTVKGRATRQSRIASVAFGLGAAGGGRRAVLHWGGNIFARYTTASSKGKHPWRDGVAQSQSQVLAAHAQVQRQALRSVI
jgi:hypothetical protein